MFSIRFEGATVVEVNAQALDYVMRMAGANAPVGVAQGEAPPEVVSAALDAVAAPPLVEEERIPPQGEPVRRRRTRAEIDAARAAEAEALRVAAGLSKPTPETQTQPVPAPVEAADAPITFEDLKKALTLVCETNGQGVEGAQALMKEFSCTRLSQIPEASWPQFIEKATARVVGGGK